MEEDKEWLVQKNLLANTNDSSFAVPNTLISTRNLWIPVANPMDQPCYICKGEIIGTLHNPVMFFDKPSSPENFQAFAKHASAVAGIIGAQLSADAVCHAELMVSNTDVSKPDDTNKEENYGPKMAAMPDLTTYPSSKMEFINVGSLPDHPKESTFQQMVRSLTNKSTHTYSGWTGPNSSSYVW